MMGATSTLELKDLRLLQGQLLPIQEDEDEGDDVGTLLSEEVEDASTTAGYESRN